MKKLLACVLAVVIVFCSITAGFKQWFAWQGTLTILSYASVLLILYLAKNRLKKIWTELKTNRRKKQSGKKLGIVGETCSLIVDTICYLAQSFYFHVFLQHKLELINENPPEIVPNRILFHSDVDFTDNARALSDYMVSNHYNEKYEIVWCVDDPPKYVQYKTKNVKFIKRHMKYYKRTLPACQRMILSSKYVIYTHAMNWVKNFPMGQVYIDLWHGCGFKAQNSKKMIYFDKCLVPGDVFVKTKAEFFSCEEKKILPIGYPRYDLMLAGSSKANALARRIKEQTDSDTLILWMPTFRKSTVQRLDSDTLNSAFDLPIVDTAEKLSQMNRVCKENRITIVLKQHHLQKKYEIPNEKLTNIICLNDEDFEKESVQLYEFIHEADALITDYSSISVDYLLLDRPIAYTLDDFEQYREARGFSFDDPRIYMPGNHVYNFEDMRKFLQQMANSEDSFAQERESVCSLLHNKQACYSKAVLDYFDIQQPVQGE